MDEECEAVEAKKNEWPSVTRCFMWFRCYFLMTKKGLRLSVRRGVFIIFITVLIHDGEEIRIEEHCHCGRSRSARNKRSPFLRPDIAE